LAASAADAAVSVEEILAICGHCLAPGAAEQLSSRPAVSALDDPESAGPDSLTFVGSTTPLRTRAGLTAALILAGPDVDVPAAEEKGLPMLRVASVHTAMAALLQALEPRILRRAAFPFGAGNRIAPSAVVEGCLEGDVSVGPGAYVGKGSFIGAGTRIEANAAIQDHVYIGRACVIQSGAVIGSAGFGFFQTSTGLQAMPHLAGVEIGSDCWIGANAVIAAGVLHPTSLGRGCKLDSHVQIAHNVRLGDNCLLASQSGIAGSTVAGNRLRMGGASSVAGHLRLGDDISIAACSGVTKDQPDRAVLAGFPARPIREWRLQQIALKRGDKT
jgi:UDP-3-O-[3-hydroxymyristoyl] glucosamine N-acyltransferase